MNCPEKKLNEKSYNGLVIMSMIDEDVVTFLTFISYHIKNKQLIHEE